MKDQQITEMGRAAETMGDAEFQQKFRMTKDEFLNKYEKVATGTGPTAASTWTKKSPVPETATNSSNSSSIANTKGGTAKGLGAIHNASVAEKKKAQELKQSQADARQKRLDAAYDRRNKKRTRAIDMMGRNGSVGTMGFLGALVDGYFTYGDERSQDPNGSKLVDAAKATGTAAAWLYAPGLMWAITGANLATSLGTAVFEDANENYQKKKSESLHISQDASGNAKGTLGGQLIDSETAYTMRQRSEQVMRQHKIATETILGSEARQLHR